MEKKEIKKILAGMGIASLLAGAGLTLGPSPVQGQGGSG